MCRSSGYRAQVLLVYVTFEVAGDLDGFVPWYAGLVQLAALAPGCVRFDFLMDPVDAHRGVTVEMWESEADRNAYLLLPHHIEMVALATAEWGMGDFESYYFKQVGPPTVARRPRSEIPVAGRPEMNSLVAEALRARGLGHLAAMGEESCGKSC
jgi:quinol monooxygenase YgiN